MAPIDGSTPLRVNHAKAKLAAGGVVTALGGVNDPDTADFLGQTDIDAIWIEAEHGGFDFSDIGDMTRACDLWGKTPLVRVGRAEANTIYRTLDRGAQGVVVPHVETRAQAELVVDSAKFAPIGHRGKYGSRRSYGDPEFFTRANDDTMVVALIEDVVAIDNLDEILKVDHIDVFQVAYSDLAQSMGYADHEHPAVQEAISEAIGRIVAAGRNAGAGVTFETIDHYVEMGTRFLYVDLTEWILSGAARYSEALRAAAS